MSHLRQLLARYWASLRGRGDADDDADSSGPTEAAVLRQRLADDRRWAEERKHFWAEFHEGQRQAEDNSRPPR